MIEQTKFLGLPLKTQHQRRLVVVLYYLLLLAVDCIALWMGKRMINVLVGQSAILGGMLGGITMGGPVKNYEERVPTSGVQVLNLQGRRPFGNSPHLDERERAQRDQAHYTAYRILRLTLGILTVAYFMVLDNPPHWLKNITGLAAWSVLIFASSLPQSVLLWTEPNAPTADIIEIPIAS